MNFSNINGITIKIGGDTTGLDKALKGVDKTTKDLQGELKGVNKLLKMDPKNVELVRQKEALLNKSIDETNKKLKTLKEAQNQMKAKGIDENSAAYREVQREIAATENKLKSLNAEQKKFTSKTRQIAQVGESYKKVGSKMKTVGSTASMYVTAPIVAAGVASASAFAEVDKTMQLANKTMGNTTTEAELLNDAMEKAAKNSTFGMSDAATAALNFARAGLTAAEAAAAIAPAMNLAAGEGGELDTVSAGLTATINSFGDSFDQTAHYADVFANACNNSALDVNSLSDAMSVAGPMFASIGYSVNDAALYMGLMADKGIEAGVAANSLKTGLARLVSPAKQGSEWMEKLGINVTNADGSMKSTIQIQKELHDTFEGLSDSEKAAAASAIFGKNQMSAWLALIETSPSRVNELADAVGAEGTTTEMAAAMMSGFGGSLESMKSSIDVASTALGKAMAPAIQKVAEWLSKAVDWFIELSPAGQRMVAVVLAIVAAIGPLLVIGGTLIFTIGQFMTILPALSTAISGLGTVFGVIKSAMTGLWTVMMANPIVLVIAAIAALVAAFVILWKKSESFRNFWKGLWSNIKSVVGAVVEWIKNTFSNLPSKMLEVGKNIVTGLWNGIKGAGEWLKNKISGFVTGVIDSFKSFFGIASPSKEMADQIGKWIPEGLGAGITANLSGLQSAVDTMGGVVMDSPSLSLAGMTDEISNAIGTGLAVQGSGATFPGAINVVVELGGTKVGEKIVSLYDYTKRAKG